MAFHPPLTAAAIPCVTATATLTWGAPSVDICSRDGRSALDWQGRLYYIRRTNVRHRQFVRSQPRPINVDVVLHTAVVLVPTLSTTTWAYVLAPTCVNCENQCAFAVETLHCIGRTTIRYCQFVRSTSRQINVETQLRCRHIRTNEVFIGPNYKASRYICTDDHLLSRNFLKHSIKVRKITICAPYLHSLLHYYY